LGRTLATPAFSIITATYNAGDLFSRTASSIRAQEYRDFEWVVIDGGSSDDTVARIRDAESSIAYWESARDRGISDAWNKGIKQAKGRFVLILNAGDTYDPNCLRVLSQNLESDKIVCSHARLMSSDGQEVGVFRAAPSKLYRGMHLPHNWCAVPRACYEDLGLYAEVPLAMDFDWFHRYYKKFGTQGFRVVDAVLGTYYLGGKSDLNHVESFRANERILLQQGASRAVAKFYRFSYTAKHIVKKWLIRNGAA
jgi:glycosyltransferase involved in cell wall biosynthesis